MSMTREEAIDYNKNLKMYMKISDEQNPCKFLEENYIALDMAIKALKEQRPHGEWIPCSERLPKPNELVVASLKTGVQLCEYAADGSSDSWFSLTDNCWVFNRLIKAWMPLPEPYREEANG